MSVGPVSDDRMLEALNVLGAGVTCVSELDSRRSSVDGRRW